MYDLMFIKEAPLDHVFNSEHDHWKEFGGTFNYLRMTIDNCMEAGHFKGHEPEALSYMIWATVHGLVSLNIRKRCEVVLPHRQENIVADGLEEFYKILDRL